MLCLQGEGIAYRGRMLIELRTALEEKPEFPIVDIEPDDLVRVSKYMRRHKYMLHVAFLEATMVCDTDGPVEFEVSIGRSSTAICVVIDSKSDKLMQCRGLTIGLWLRMTELNHNDATHIFLFLAYSHPARIRPAHFLV